MYSIIATLGVSLLSLIGIFFFQFKNLYRYTKYFVALSAGALIGDVFVHILPEMVEEYGFGEHISFTIIAAILTYFILEGVLRWHHSHSSNDKDLHNTHAKEYVGWMSLAGDLAHNTIDGIAIASSFLIDVRVGIITTIAIVLHEIPQEIGNFGLLMHVGFKKSRALMLNFLTALSAVLGAVFVNIANEQAEIVTPYFLAFSVGSLLYIALSDMIPEVHENNHKALNIPSFLFFVFGIVVISLLKFVGVE
jgi:zinc and cadmium transporter